MTEPDALPPKVLIKLQQAGYFDDSNYRDVDRGIFHHLAAARLRRVATDLGLIPSDDEAADIAAMADIYDGLPVPWVVPLDLVRLVIGREAAERLRNPLLPNAKGFLVSTEDFRREYDYRATGARRGIRGRGRPPVPPRYPWPFTDPVISTSDVEWVEETEALPPRIADCLPRSAAGMLDAGHIEVVSNQWRKIPAGRVAGTFAQDWLLMRWVAQTIDHYHSSDRRSPLPGIYVPTSTAAPIPRSATGPAVPVVPTRRDAVRKIDPRLSSTFHCPECNTVYDCRPGDEEIAFCKHKSQAACWPDYNVWNLVDEYPELIPENDVQRWLRNGRDLPGAPDTSR